MNDVVKYLQECGTFYLATVEGDQPHVRPFGAVCEFEGKLYIVTNNKKDVYNQMKVNGKVEIFRLAEAYNCFSSARYSVWRYIGCGFWQYSCRHYRRNFICSSGRSIYICALWG